MLDTNIVSYFVRAHPIVNNRLLATPPSSICISVLTKAELLYGLERKQISSKLQSLLNEFIHNAKCLDWNDDAAEQYAVLRANLETCGIGIAPIDLLIASHTLSLKATLVSNDKAFQHIPNLKLEDWTKP